MRKMSRPKGFRITILSMNMMNQSHRIVYLIPGPLKDYYISIKPREVCSPQLYVIAGPGRGVILLYLDVGAGAGCWRQCTSDLLSCEPVVAWLLSVHQLNSSSYTIQQKLKVKKNLLKSFYIL